MSVVVTIDQFIKSGQPFKAKVSNNGGARKIDICLDVTEAGAASSRAFVLQRGGVPLGPAAKRHRLALATDGDETLSVRDWGSASQGATLTLKALEPPTDLAKCTGTVVP